MIKRQKGSVLVGVLALSVAMTVAAGGLIMLAANTAKDGSQILEDRALHYVAESATYMGVRWVRSYLQTEIPVTWDDSLVLTPGADGFTVMDDVWVKVKFVDDPGGGGGHFAIKTWATLGAGRDTLLIIWQINSLGTPTSGSGLNSNAYLADWTETLLPGST
ncbi:MAG: hypothetical protein M3Y08_11105 [Fibrobacterota bacterium]|nr:hypothetical protein [Fibrobacterota bacterium]